MMEIRRTAIKTKVHVLAVVDRAVVDYTLEVYGVTPESKNFLEAVNEELGMVSNGRAELYKVIKAAVMGHVIMSLPVSIFVKHAAIVKEKDGSVTMFMDANTFEALATIIENEDE